MPKLRLLGRLDEVCTYLCNFQFNLSKLHASFIFMKKKNEDYLIFDEYLLVSNLVPI